MTDNSGTVDMDETVSFNMQVVPEFATLAVMVLALSITAVLALSRLKPNNANCDLAGWLNLEIHSCNLFHFTNFIISCY